MKTNGNFWFPAKEQTRWPDEAQLFQSEAEAHKDEREARLQAESSVFVYAPDTMEVKESVTINNIVYTPAEIKTLLHFAKPKEVKRS